jgi:hypothetical protein
MQRSVAAVWVVLRLRLGFIVRSNILCIDVSLIRAESGIIAVSVTFLTIAI